MSQQRDIAAILDQWLTDGPTEVPDRVLESVVSRIERETQRLGWRLDWRLPRLGPQRRLFVVVAAAVVVAVVGINLINRPAPVVIGPVPSTSPPPSLETSPSPPASLGLKFGLKVGSDTFGASGILAEVYAQALEAAGYPVTRVPAFGSTLERLAAFDRGDMDLMPEYPGWRLGYAPAGAISRDPTTNEYALQFLYDSNGSVGRITSTTPGAETVVGVVRADTAGSLKLATLSDLAAAQGQLTWGLPADCATNRLCKGALEAYGITYPPAHVRSAPACVSSTAQALHDRTIDFAWLCATEPAIAGLGLVVLADDKAVQPPGNVMPVVRSGYVANYTDAGDRNAFFFVIDGVTAQLTTAELTKLELGVFADNKAISDVARQWLIDQGLPRLGTSRNVP